MMKLRLNLRRMVLEQECKQGMGTTEHIETVQVSMLGVIHFME